MLNINLQFIGLKIFTKVGLILGNYKLGIKKNKKGLKALIRA
jgi:hypothetical protein